MTHCPAVNQKGRHNYFKARIPRIRHKTTHTLTAALLESLWAGCLTDVHLRNTADTAEVHKDYTLKVNFPVYK